MLSKCPNSGMIISLIASLTAPLEPGKQNIKHSPLAPASLLQIKQRENHSPKCSTSQYQIKQKEIDQHGDQLLNI